MVNTIFSNALAFYSVNSALIDCIQLHCSIRQGCPLDPYLYVLAADAFGYLLELAQMQGRILGISLLDRSDR